MPNLLVATGIFHPEPGGPSTYLRQIAPALQERGWDVRVVSYGERSSTEYPYLVRRIERKVYPLRLAKYGAEIRGHADWADLVYAHSIDLPLWGISAPRALKVVGDQAWERCMRKRWIPPDLNIDRFQDYRGGWRARWQQASRSRQAKTMDAVIVPSLYLRRMVENWGVAGAKLQLIYNALPQLETPIIDRAALRAELGWGSRPVLLSVARLQPWKGIDHLITVLPELPELQLVVVGDGPDLPRLQTMAAEFGDRVRFLGYRSQTEARELMAAADGLALYSGYEGLSHTLLECLQMGTPVLASDKGGNPEIVRDGCNGVLVPHIDLEALRQGIKRLMRRRDQLAANTLTGMDRFSFENMVERTDRLLRSLLR